MPESPNLVTLQWRRAYRFEKAVNRGDLIPFRWIADWLARDPGKVERNEERRALVYADLLDSAIRGEFGLHGPLKKPNVAYLPEPPPVDPDRLLTDREVAIKTNRARSTLQEDRVAGRGIPFVRIGRRQIRYKESIVDRYIAELPERRSTSETDAA